MNRRRNKLTTRREFISKTGMAAAGVTVAAANLSSISCGRSIGPNDKIRMGFIGIGNRGTQVMDLFRAEPDVEVAALCDIYQPYLDRDYSKVHPRYKELCGDKIPKMGENFPPSVKKYTDYRQLLDDKSIDAVLIAPQDHWHAIMTIDSLKAGKHVYVEKPLAKTVKEGRAIIEASKKHPKQVVQVGLSRRGSSTYHKLAAELPAGKIGKITYAGGSYVSNMFPNGIGKLQPEEPPKDFNWDMWLGPKPMRPYQYNIAPYMFRWWEEYDNQIANNGVHSLDLLRWLLNEKSPKAITSIGGKYAVEDDRTIPDTMQTIFEFPSGVIVNYTTLEATSGKFTPFGMLEFRGTKAILYAGGANDYKLVPAVRGQFQTWEPQAQPEDYAVKPAGKGKLADGTYAEPTANLVRNFLDCIKNGKKPIIPAEEAHISTNMAHLATISMLVKQRLEWDAEKEVVTNSEEANKYLHYEYRKPWKLG